MDRGPGEWDAEEPAREGTMSVKKSEGFTAEERAAMKERAKELKAEAQKADGERSVIAKIAEMPQTDRAMAERLHEVVMWATSFALKELGAAEEAKIGALVKRAAG